MGEWVNVMGYNVAVNRVLSDGSSRDSLEVHIQALILWSAGPLSLDSYEQILDEQKTNKETTSGIS
jgi:hypothetical protein